MKKLVVFDVDGTILNSFALYERAVTHYSRENGLPDPCLETIRRGYGDPHAHDFKWGVDKDAQYRHLINTFELASRWETSGHPDHMPTLFEGAHDTLTALKDTGHTLAIVTSRPFGALEHTLRRIGVFEMFSGIRTGSDVKGRGEREKPEPDQLLSVMRELGFHAPETIMIGDTVMDVKMGLAAKTHTVGVTWGVHPRSYLEDAGAHHIIDTHAGDIPHIAQKIFS